MVQSAVDDCTVLTSTPVDEKGHIADDIRNQIFRKLRSKTDNRICFDCNGRNPTWVSLNYGIYLCLECSGDHRRFGVHISFIRSCDMDSFTPYQICQMAIGGNGKAREFFKTSGIDGKRKESGSLVQLNYNDKVAAKYRQHMEKETKKFVEELGVETTCVSPSAASNKTLDTQHLMLGSEIKDSNALIPEVTSPKTVDSGVQILLSPLNKNNRPIQPKNVVVTSGNSPVARSSPSPAVLSKAADTLAKKSSTVTRNIDLDDFDFDDFEKEAVAPCAAPSNRAPTSMVAPVSTGTKNNYMGIQNPKSNINSGFASSAQYGNRKGIGSDEVFAVHDTPQERMLKETKMESFKNAGAISSDAFFGQPRQETDHASQLKSEAEHAAQKGMEAIQKGFSLGSKMASDYANQVRASLQKSYH